MMKVQIPSDPFPKYCIDKYTVTREAEELYKGFLTLLRRLLQQQKFKSQNGTIPFTLQDASHSKFEGAATEHTVSNQSSYDMYLQNREDWGGVNIPQQLPAASNRRAD